MDMVYLFNLTQIRRRKPDRFAHLCCRTNRSIPQERKTT